MIIDSRLKLSDGQAVTVTAASDGFIDLENDRNVGKGQPLYFVVIVDADLDGSDGNETYSVSLQADDNSSFSSATDLVTLDFTRGDATGTKQVGYVPYSNERYLRVRFAHGGTTPSGSYTAFITSEEPASWEAFPDGEN